MKLIDGELLPGEKKCPKCWLKRQFRTAAMIWCAAYWVTELIVHVSLRTTGALCFMVVFTCGAYAGFAFKHPPHA